MYLFIGSSDSTDIHSENNSCEFIIELPRHINLEGNWTCAILECDIGPDTWEEELYISCDLIQNSCVHGKLAPVLAVVNKTTSFTNPFYIPVSKDNVYRMRIQLLTKEGRHPENKPIDSRIVLHLRKE